MVYLKKKKVWYGIEERRQLAKWENFDVGFERATRGSCIIFYI